MRVACAVLAAGASRRLGFPKQLVTLQGEPLVRRAALAALASGCVRTALVLGAHAGLVRPALAGLDVEILQNELWNEGMSGSIRLAACWASAGGFDALLLALVDQVALSSSHLAALIAASEGGERPVASYYAGKRGVPALFPRENLGRLCLLHGDVGARGVLATLSSLHELSWPEGELDLDEVADFARCEFRDRVSKGRYDA